MPTGYNDNVYESIEGGHIFHRCHLMAYQLTGQNDNPQNLVTGTRYLNVLGMKPFEDGISRYVHETGHKVLYRVTPHFVGDELVCRGIQMEALSIGDAGKGVRLNVYCYNVQPGFDIDYDTGGNWRSDTISENN